MKTRDKKIQNQQNQPKKKIYITTFFFVPTVDTFSFNNSMYTYCKIISSWTQSTLIIKIKILLVLYKKLMVFIEHIT